MTSPCEKIMVECPECGEVYKDWYRASMNLAMDDFDDAYIEEASTATCPSCGCKVAISTLIIERDGTWILGEDDEKMGGGEG